MLKLSLPRFAAFLPLLLAATAQPLHAADFIFHQNNTNTGLTWNSNGVWLDGSENPYPNGVFPGENDTILSVNWDGTEGVPNLYLNGDQKVRRFETAYYDANNRPSTRIYSGSPSGSNTGVTNTLTVGEEFHHTAGSLYIRSAAGSTLNIEAPILRLGLESDTSNAALFEIASSTAGQGNVNLLFEQTIFGGHAARLTIAKTFSPTGGSINLGHVLFDMNVQTGFQFSAGITLATDADPDTVITVASLRGAAHESRGSITGPGTLVIDSNASTFTLTEPAIFNRLITGALAVKKRGDALQILSYANTYTGGTTIEGGVLAVRNTSDSGLGTGAVTVKSGAVLAGNGIVALVTGKSVIVESGGIIAPGEDNRILSEATVESLTRQTLTVHGTTLDLKDGANVNFRAFADGSSDQIALTGYQADQLLLGENVTVNFTGALIDGQTYTLFTFSDANGNPIASGLTGGLVAGTGFEGYHATFHYDDLGYGGVGSISVSVAAIPEPSSAALLLLPVTAGLLYRKFRATKH